MCVCVWSVGVREREEERDLYEVQVCSFSPSSSAITKSISGIIVLRPVCPTVCASVCPASCTWHTHTHAHIPQWVHSTLMKWKDNLRMNRWHQYLSNYVTEFGFPHPYRWFQANSKQSASVFRRTLQPTTTALPSLFLHSVSVCQIPFKSSQDGVVDSLVVF